MNDDTIFSIPFVNCSFACNYLSNMDIKKAMGLDSIGPPLLKLLQMFKPLPLLI